MSWRPEQFTEGKWYPNALRFATPEEAEKSAFNKFYNWYNSQGHRAVESDDPVNYKWVDGVGDVPLEDKNG